MLLQNPHVLASLKASGSSGGLKVVSSQGASEGTSLAKLLRCRLETCLCTDQSVCQIAAVIPTDRQGNLSVAFTNCQNQSFRSEAYCITLLQVPFGIDLKSRCSIVFICVLW